jgi:hypothetical protein
MHAYYYAHSYFEHVFYGAKGKTLKKSVHASYIDYSELPTVDFMSVQNFKMSFLCFGTISTQQFEYKESANSTSN